MGYLQKAKLSEMPKNIWFFEHDTWNVGYMKYALTVSKNLIVSDKIGSIARSYGFDVVARTGDEAIAKAKLARPAVIVVDLEGNQDFLEKLKISGISSLVLGFYPHMKADIRRSAAALGYSNVFPNSMMEAKMKEIFSKLTA